MTLDDFEIFSDEEKLESIHEALQVELSGKVEFDVEMVLERIGIDKIAKEFVTQCVANLHNNSAFQEAKVSLKDLVKDAMQGETDEEVLMIPHVVG